MQIPLTVVRAGEVTTAMRENLQTADGLSWIIAHHCFYMRVSGVCLYF